MYQKDKDLHGIHEVSSHKNVEGVKETDSPVRVDQSRTTRKYGVEFTMKETSERVVKSNLV